MSGAAVVFRTADPDAVAAFSEACADYEAWAGDLREWVSANLGDEFRPVITEAFGARTVHGVVRADGEAEPGPGEGWRYVKSTGWWVPDKRYKAGKALLDRFDPNGNRAPSPRDRTPGMPGFHFDVGSPGLLLHDGALWASWSRDVGDEEWEREGVDLGLWERARLSEFHAAREAREVAS